MPLSQGLIAVFDSVAHQMDWISSAADQLASQGWYYGDRVLNPTFVRSLNKFLDDPKTVNSFRPAAIGRGSRHQNNQDVRRDLTLWLDDCREESQTRDVTTLIETIRLHLNRELLAGLADFEGHFALYPAGGFYQRHLDTFRDDDRRFLTFLLYLNSEWTHQDGGQLRLFTCAKNHIDIEPRGGSVLIFRSRDFEHEVLTSHVERRSFTGWFRV